ncbi:MAG: CoA-transferase [Candidatus Hadarchaeales archaeon]
MGEAESKITTLRDAVKMVPDGAMVAIGGFTTQRHPMAFVHELIRQKKRNLHLVGHSPGGDWDLLIGAGCVKRVELAYEADEAFARIGPRFRLAVQRGEIEWEDYSNFGMVQRFAAGAMGIPFIPTKTMLGSDMLRKEGFSPETRKDPKVAKKKFVEMICPFTGEKVVLLPALQPDVTIIHAQIVDVQGTVRIYGQNFGDEQMAKAAKKVIVTCEEIVQPEEIRDFPEHNCIPFFRVNAIVRVPYGAHPYACYRYYDYDPEFLRMYHTVARDDESFHKFLEEYIYSVSDWGEYLRKVGGDEKLRKLKADKKLGYAPTLKRR